jgi:hypothetical protein
MDTMNKYQRIGLRVGISMTIGLLVATIALVVAWRDIGSMRQVRPEQWATDDAIFQIEDMIKMDRGTSKTLPGSLEEVRGLPERQVHFQRDEKGRPLDGWGRPLLYATDGDKYVITSLGQDGKPGGIGLDYDLSNRTTWPSCADALPTFAQFLAHPATRGVILACLVCGPLAFLVSFVTVNPRALHGWAILALVVKLAVTILGALFVASFMSFAEIPNYH